MTTPSPTAPPTSDQDAIRALPWSGPVDLDQVWAYVTPAYGGDTWDEVLTAMMSWPSEAATVTTLAAELADRLATDPAAHFDEPIRVTFTDPADWDAEDEAEHGPCPVRPRLGNGMHRVIATRLAGGTTVWVTTETGESDDDVEYVEISFTITDVPAEVVEESDDAEFYRDSPQYAVSSWLRSFRLDEHVWVEDAGTSTSCGTMSSLYYCPHTHARALAAELADRAGELGATLTVSLWRCVTGRELEEEHEQWRAANPTPRDLVTAGA